MDGFIATLIGVLFIVFGIFIYAEYTESKKFEHPVVVSEVNGCKIYKQRVSGKTIFINECSNTIMVAEPPPMIVPVIIR